MIKGNPLGKFLMSLLYLHLPFSSTFFFGYIYFLLTLECLLVGYIVQDTKDQLFDYCPLGGNETSVVLRYSTQMVCLMYFMLTLRVSLEYTNHDMQYIHCLKKFYYVNHLLFKHAYILHLTGRSQKSAIIVLSILWYDKTTGLNYTNSTSNWCLTIVAVTRPIKLLKFLLLFSFLNIFKRL